MKALYIAILSNTVPGVIKKITNSILHLNSDNFQTQGLIVSTGEVKGIQEYENIKIIHVPPIRLKDHHELIYDAISKYIATYLETPLIYFRYPIANKYLLGFMKRWGQNIVFEHNGIEEKELKMYQKYYSIKDFFYNLKNLNFSDYLGHKKTMINEKKYGESVCALALGGISMTSEIGEYQNQRSRNPNYTLAVIGNSINLGVKPPVKLQFQPIEGKIRCVFVAGQANNWHGIDRVLKGILAYTGNVKIELIYVGAMNSMAHNLCENPKIAEAITHFPHLNNEDLNETIRNSDIGVSSLGVHRVDVKQACVLKTREYISCGLPIVFSYEDEEIERDRILSKCIFKASSDESIICFDDLIKFLNDLSKDDITPQIIADHAWERFSIKQKSQELKEILLRAKNPDLISEC